MQMGLVGKYLKYASLPASMALASWSRRGEITCDRAGLLCCGSLEVALTAMLKLVVGHKLSETLDVEEYVGQLDELGKDDSCRVSDSNSLC